jgi:hypothetical protein
VCPAAGDAGRYHLSDFDHREACAAYIDSQRHEGWLALDDHYDDGGYSVGTLERLALQRLIRDIEAPAEGRIYRYYVTREAIADGYVTCPVTSVPAADVEGAVLDHIQKLLAAPELVARTWAAAKREGEDEIPNARSPSCSPTSPPSGTSCSPPSKRGSFSCWSSGSTCRRTPRSADQSRGPREPRCRTSGSPMRGERREEGRRDAARRQHPGRADPDAIPTARWAQTHRGTGRQRACARAETRRRTAP